MRVRHLLPLAALTAIMACADQTLTDVDEPLFDYMNNPQAGPVVFTSGGSSIAWSTDPDENLGFLWGATYEDFCDPDVVLPSKGHGHWTQTTAGAQMHWMEDEVNLTVLPIVAPGFPAPGTSPFGVPPELAECEAQPLYVGHGKMRMTSHQSPEGYFDILHYNIRGDVEDGNGESYKLNYQFNYQCSAMDDCDLKKQDLDIR